MPLQAYARDKARGRDDGSGDADDEAEGLMHGDDKRETNRRACRQTNGRVRLREMRNREGERGERSLKGTEKLRLKGRRGRWERGGPCAEALCVRLLSADETEQIPSAT
ncbi:unnamed protein product [Pleuronectes platessa]|uniref:Uncharacterized protein n=1 Tax=Pleuronectes platessa TaxID=8262 RepID=A0A9N7TNZ3_PLEPL|nr:unnamed protein product [Pleuronectes platessa]